MKSILALLRLLGIALAVAIGIALLIAIAGWLLGWDNSTAYSNGMFVGAAIVLGLGALALVGGEDITGYLISTPAEMRKDPAGIEADVIESHSAYIFLFCVGAYLVILSILIDKLFGPMR